MHRHCSRDAAVDIGHVGKHQLLTLHTTCAHVFALDLTVLIASPGTVCINLPGRIASPGIAVLDLTVLIAFSETECICLPVLNASPGTVHSHASHNCRRGILAGHRNLDMEHNMSQHKPPQTECGVKRKVEVLAICTRVQAQYTSP